MHLLKINGSGCGAVLKIEIVKPMAYGLIVAVFLQ